VRFRPIWDEPDFQAQIAELRESIVAEKASAAELGRSLAAKCTTMVTLEAELETAKKRAIEASDESIAHATIEIVTKKAQLAEQNMAKAEQQLGIFE
jgi:uncharacterized protein involved in exopolysaccharide biosynthesis